MRPKLLLLLTSFRTILWFAEAEDLMPTMSWNIRTYTHSPMQKAKTNGTQLSMWIPFPAHT